LEGKGREAPQYEGKTVPARGRYVNATLNSM